MNALVWCEGCQGNHSDRACVDLAPRKSYTLSVDECSSYRVAVFSRAAVEAAIGASVNQEDHVHLIAELTGWGARYGGPGRGFAEEPTIRIGKRSIVIRQFCGLDI